MKRFRKIAFTFLIFIILILGSGYFYFNHKFTPNKNYLTVKNESGNLPVTWLGNNKNVMLLPVHFKGNSETYYLQFDTGSPYTMFYSDPIRKIKEILVKDERAETVFHVGNTEISSKQFKIITTGNSSQDSLKIIGTLGADVLEDRRTVIDFKRNSVFINVSDADNAFKRNMMDFKFNKRKIVISGILKNKERNFLYDSGTSAYEFLTYKEEWEALKLENSEVKTEKVKSWDATLTTFTAPCDEYIKFNTHKIPVKEVTYVEGMSGAQLSLMKFTGMSGMIGNKLFLRNRLFIDGKNMKFGID